MATNTATGNRRRSSVEKALADTILAESAKHAPDPAAFAAAKRYTDGTVASKRFDSHNRTPEGYEIKRFHRIGETVVGVLGECNGQTGYGESTYPLVQDDGSILCVPGNRRLVKAFRKAKATFQRIRITFKGKIYTHNGRHEKVYAVEVEPAPLGKGKE